MAKPQLRSSKYWEERSTQRMSKALRTSQSYYAQVRLVYAEAKRQTVADIQSMYRAYYRKVGSTEAQFDRARLNDIAPQGDIKRYFEQMRGLGLTTALPENYGGRMTRLQLINAQMELEIQKAALKEQTITKNAFRRIMNDAYYQAGYETSQGMGVTPLSFGKLDTQTVEAILMHQFEGKNFSERIWGNSENLAKQLKEKLAYAVASGQPLEKTVREFSERFGVKDYYAERLIRTETCYFQMQGEIASYRAMGLEKFMFVATLDSRTSDICQSMDRHIFSVKEAALGENVPPLHPNCRSCIRPYIGREYEPQERIARDPHTNENYTVRNMSYPMWKKTVSDHTPLLLGGVPTIKKSLYDSLRKVVDNAPKNVQSVWNKYEDQLGIARIDYDGQSKYDPTRGGVYINMAKDARGSAYSEPFRVTFHEFGHNIDFLAGSNKKPLSHVYKNGLFAKTLKEEAQSLIKGWRQEAVKSVDGIKRVATYDQIGAYLRKKLGDSKHSSYISDILSGATNNSLRVNSGHSGTYWRESSMRLPAEAFTQMFSASLVSKEGLDLIVKYFPKSYNVFKDILKEAVK